MAIVAHAWESSPASDRDDLIVWWKAFSHELTLTMTVFAVVCTQKLMGRAMWGLTMLSQLAFGEIGQRQALHGVSGWNDRPSAKEATEP